MLPATFGPTSEQFAIRFMVRMWHDQIIDLNYYISQQKVHGKKASQVGMQIEYIQGWLILMNNNSCYTFSLLSNNKSSLSESTEWMIRVALSK